MSLLLEHSTSADAPFDAIAGIYDEVFSNSSIGRAQREAVWTEMDREFHGGQSILEINCGTGIDAIHLALRGVRVDACDSAPKMIAKAEQQFAAISEAAPVSFRCLAIEQLDQLAPEIPYDGVLSNFSGLNCVEDLRPAVRSLARLVQPGGRAVVCVFGSFCLWEVCWYLARGDFKRAFRRLRRQDTRAALGPDTQVAVHYWSVGYLSRTFAPGFKLKRVRGVGVLSPPSYAPSFPARFPKVFRLTVAMDRLLGRCPLLRAMADHVVLIFERLEDEP